MTVTEKSTKAEILAAYEETATEFQSAMDKIAHMSEQLAAAEAQADAAADAGIEDACRIIAEHFYEPGMVYNRELGESIRGNQLAFVQKFVLGNMVYSVHRAAEWFAEKLREEKRKVTILTERMPGGPQTEFDAQEIHRALDAVERRVLEMSTVADLSLKLKAQYKTSTGEDWVPRDKKVVDPTIRQRRPDLNDRLKSLGVDANFGHQPDVDGNQSTEGQEQMAS